MNTLERLQDAQQAGLKTKTFHQCGCGLHACLNIEVDIAKTKDLEETAAFIDNALKEYKEETLKLQGWVVA